MIDKVIFMLYRQKLIYMNKDRTVDIPDGCIFVRMISDPIISAIPGPGYDDEKYWDENNRTYRVIVLEPVD